MPHPWCLPSNREMAVSRISAPALTRSRLATSFSHVAAPVPATLDAVNGRSTPDSASVGAIVRELQPGDEITISVLRAGAPVELTANGKAHSDDGRAGNLPPGRYDEFAAYLRDVILTLRQRDGVEVDYLSPFNEPQWDWTSGQEGSPWRVDEMAAMVRKLWAEG